MSPKKISNDGLDEVDYCRGRCRDETSCLNKGNYSGYCWKHYKEPTIVIEGKIKRE